MAKKDETPTVEFINPFAEGVDYEQFYAAIPEGVTIEDYCKEHLTHDQIQWLVEDLKHFTKQLK